MSSAPASQRAARPSLLAVAAMPVLPIANGYSLRVSNFVRELAGMWRVILAAPLGACSETELVQQLGVHRFVPLPFFRGWSSPLTDQDRREMRALFDRLIEAERPDAALVWADAEPAALGNPSFPPVVFDRLDSEVVMAWRELRAASGMTDRMRAARSAAIWARRERRLVRSAAATVVDVSTDARVLRRVSGRNTVHTIPNGVIVERGATAKEESRTPTVVLSGSMSFSANVRAASWFVRSVWPAVRAAVPTARFLIAGRDPAAEVLALTGAAGVEVTGDVPDITAVLRDAWIAIAPVITGSGIRTKVLEAWAVGKPVVMSSVAASGMPLDTGTASLVVDSEQRTAETVVRLLANHDERHALGAAAHAFVEREYGGWRRPAVRMSELLTAISTGSRRR